VAEALRFQPRDPLLDFDALQQASDYWEAVRRQYAPYETGQLAPQSDVYENEMPGGQYTNLYRQAEALGVADQWRAICRTYAEVNQLFGDIIKVTPTSKVVGDMALFMVCNNLRPKDVLDESRELAFPESVVEFFQGRLGEPSGGFPAALQRRVLRGRAPIRGRPGASLPPANFEAERANAAARIGRPIDDRELLAFLLYPRVFPDLATHQDRYSDTSVLPTPTFFYGMTPGEETSIDIEPGKTLILKFLTVGEPHADGERTVFFELNGQPREVVIQDKSLSVQTKAHPKAEPGNPLQVGAPMPGLVARVLVAPGEPVTSGQKLFALEAMKMETILTSDRSGTVAEVLVQAGSLVDAGDLLLRYEKPS
jgi:pyruvate carboxylase